MLYNEIYDAAFSLFKKHLLLCEIFIFHSSIFIILALSYPPLPSFGFSCWGENNNFCVEGSWSVIISKHSGTGATGTTHFVFHFRDYLHLRLKSSGIARRHRQQNWLWKIINKFSTVNLSNDCHTQFGFKGWNRFHPLFDVDPFIHSPHQLQVFALLGKHSEGSARHTHSPSASLKRMKSNNNERWLHNFQVMGLL